MIRTMKCTAQRAVERLDDLAELSADPLLPGFVLALREIW